MMFKFLLHFLTQIDALMKLSCSMYTCMDHGFQWISMVKL